MTTPHQQAIAIADRTNSQLGKIFKSIGLSSDQSGLYGIFSLARDSMTSALQQKTKEGRARSARRVMTSLSDSVVPFISERFDEGIDLGSWSATQQIPIFGFEPDSEMVFPASQRLLAISAIESDLWKLEKTIYALIALDSNLDLIVGDDDRLGLLTPRTLISSSIFWTSSLVWAAFEDLTKKASTSFQKQAVAAIDYKTTNCCLKVHGQIKPLETPFELEGTPRYGDRLDWPPFHFRCRTSVALYLPEFEQGETSQMEEKANAILRDRPSPPAGGS